MLTAAGRGRRRAAPTSRRAARRRRRRSRSCVELLAQPARRCCCSAAAAGPEDLRGHARLRRSATTLPVACAFRFQDLFDNRHPNYVGDVGIGINPKLAARVRDADLLLAVGPRLGEMTTGGYTLLDAPGAAPGPGPRASRAPRSSAASTRPRCRSTPACREFAAALRERAGRRPPRGAAARAGPGRLRGVAAPPAATPQPRAGPLGGGAAAAPALPADAIVTNGAGNFATWAHRFWRYRRRSERSCRPAPPAPMGYAVPVGAIARQLSPILQRTHVVASPATATS